MISAPHLRRGLAALGLPALALALALAAAALLPAPARAIIGGTPTAADRWPWMAAVLDAGRSPEWGQYCGGAVIGRRRVLTAAHCVAGALPGTVDVLIGRTRLTGPGGRRLHVTRISVHPDYTSGEAMGRDAAVLTLAEDAGVTPLALATEADAPLWAPGATAWTMGWGRLNARESPAGESYYADRLRELALPLAGDDVCESTFGIGLRRMPYRPAWSLCAGDGAGFAAPCFGDSGAPLVVQGPAGWLDVGILSGGDGCAAFGYYALYARVDGIRSFALAARIAASRPLPGAAAGSGAASRRGRAAPRTRCAASAGTCRPA